MPRIRSVYRYMRMHTERELKTTHKTNRDLWIAFLAALFSAILTFGSIAGWDFYKERKERRAIVKMLQMELAQIYGAIELNKKTIKTNQKRMEEGKESLNPLQPLKTSAWESAKLRNNIFIENTGDLKKWFFYIQPLML